MSTAGRRRSTEMVLSPVRTQKPPFSMETETLSGSHDRKELVTPMERTYTTIDKSGWGEGPWQDEPDKVQWTDETTGLPCLAKRHPSLGHLCGYVGVSESHPAFEKDYDAAHDLFPDYDEDGALDVHGGLTYAASCQEGDEAEAICHITEPGQPDHVWWLGFDCAHSGDLSPYSAARDRERGWPSIGGEKYRTLDYVRRECASLARQLATLVTVEAA